MSPALVLLGLLVFIRLPCPIDSLDVTWSDLSGTNPPPGRYGHSLICDAATETLISFFGDPGLRQRQKDGTNHAVYAMVLYKSLHPSDWMNVPVLKSRSAADLHLGFYYIASSAAVLPLTVPLRQGGGFNSQEGSLSHFVVLFGGGCPECPQKKSNSVVLWRAEDDFTDPVIAAGPRPTPRYAATLTAYPCRNCPELCPWLKSVSSEAREESTAFFVLHGGRGVKGFLDDTWLLIPTAGVDAVMKLLHILKDEVEPPPSEPADASSSGGARGAAAGYTVELRWVKLPLRTPSNDVAARIAYHSAVAHGDSVLLFAGHNGAENLNHVYRIGLCPACSPMRKVFFPALLPVVVPVPASFYPRHGHVAVVMSLANPAQVNSEMWIPSADLEGADLAQRCTGRRDDIVVLYGGATDSKFAPHPDGVREIILDDVWIFRPWDETWRIVHPRGVGPLPSYTLGGCVLGDSLFLLGGVSNGTRGRLYTPGKGDRTSSFHALRFDIGMVKPK